MNADPYFELVNKTAQLLAARHAGDRATGDRVEREIRTLLDTIRADWAAADVAAAQSGRTADPRTPGPFAVRFVADLILDRLVRLWSRGWPAATRPLAEYEAWHRGLALLTGWSDAEIAAQQAQASRRSAASGNGGGP